MKKIKSEAGFTVVEMLAAVFVLVLLSLMVGAGMSMAMHAYETVVAQSEAELLLSTAVDALADDLRYAWNVKPDESLQWTNFTYTSDSYSSDSSGHDVSLCVEKDNGKGKINAKSEDGAVQQVLSINAGAYGSSKSYKEYSVDDMFIHYSQDKNTFTIHLKVTDGSGITASTPGSNWSDINKPTTGGVTIRCLNPALPATTGGDS